jgi:fluoride exporter
MTPLDVMWVGLGGGLGSLLRWLTGRVIGEHYHGDFPVGTFLINVSGAFAIGYLSVLFKVDWRDRYGTALNAGVLTGVLGGYTTFSSMQLDAVKLAGKRGPGTGSDARSRGCPHFWNGRLRNGPWHHHRGPFNANQRSGSGG